VPSGRRVTNSVFTGPIPFSSTDHALLLQPGAVGRGEGLETADHRR